MKIMRIAFCLLLALALLPTGALAKELQRGDDSLDVMFLQARLSALGYETGMLDGDYGGKTAGAVSAFQKERGLEETGAVDEATWAALYDETATIHMGSCAVDVKLCAPFDSIRMRDDMFEGQETAHMNLMDGAASGFANIMSGTRMDAQLFILGTKDYAMGMDSAAEDQVVAEETFMIDGREAWVGHFTYDFSDESGDWTRHFLGGAVELGKFDGQTATLFMLTMPAWTRGEDLFFDLSTVREILETARVQGTETAAAPDGGLTLPDFEAVEAGTTPMMLLEPVQKYVDPDACRAEEIDADACAAMYYGARMMQWYYDDVARGLAHKAHDQLRLFMEYSPIAEAAPEEIRAKVEACRRGALMALRADAAPYLEQMDAGEANWTEDEVAFVFDALMEGLGGASEDEGAPEEAAEAPAPAASDLTDVSFALSCGSDDAFARELYKAVEAASAEYGEENGVYPLPYFQFGSGDPLKQIAQIAIMRVQSRDVMVIVPVVDGGKIDDHYAQCVAACHAAGIPVVMILPGVDAVDFADPDAQPDYTIRVAAANDAACIPDICAHLIPAMVELANGRSLPEPSYEATAR